MKKMSHIPVVDFKEYSLIHQSAEEARLNKAAFSRIAEELLYALKNVGFAYLKNTGIASEQVNDVFKAGDGFFSLPKEVKAKYYRNVKTHLGWVSAGEERQNHDRPGDLKEAFTFLPQDPTMPWPEGEIPEFRDTLTAFHSICVELVLRVLDVISYGLQLESITYLRSKHDTASGRAPTYMRLMYYIPLGNTELKPGQIRLGEHTDACSITLLFQDQAGGLEVQCRDGVYRPAKPIEDTVIINIGDLMQRWTSDVLLSNSHRVTVPEGKARDRARRSMVFFLSPNNDCIVECLDGSDKYPPVIAAEYYHSRINDLYK